MSRKLGPKDDVTEPLTLEDVRKILRQLEEEGGSLAEVILTNPPEKVIENDTDTESPIEETQFLSNCPHKKHCLGIFSEGDGEFQKAKLEKSGIKKFFDKDLVFIFPTKGDKLDYVWEKVKNLQGPVLIVDDNINHVTKISKTQFTPLLLDREGVAENTFASIRNLEGPHRLVRKVM